MRMTAILTGAEDMIPMISTLPSNAASAKTLLLTTRKNGTTLMAPTTGTKMNSTTPSNMKCASMTSHPLTPSVTTATSTTTTLTGAVAMIQTPSIPSSNAACAKLKRPMKILLCMNQKCASMTSLPPMTGVMTAKTTRSIQAGAETTTVM